MHVGVGLTLFRAGRVTFGAIPFFGHTRWAPNAPSITSHREAYIALGGPAANLVPFEHAVHGHRMSSDGARALRLLRP